MLQARTLPSAGLRRLVALGAAAAAAACVAAVPGAPSPAAAAAASRAALNHAAAGGKVAVLYAASLERLMQGSIAPAFHSATGYTMSGYAEGSQALANQVKAGTLQGDVFISASPAVNATLEGAANGGWLSWYATFASSPLVLGYNAHSRFAPALRRGPWWKVVTEPGFRIGRTDPAIDPKGVLVDELVQKAAAADHVPSLASLTASAGNEYPEQTLVGLVSSGQLDAGFFYSVESSAAGIPTVALDPRLASSYTVTVLAKAPDGAAAVAFVKYLLSRPSLRLLRRGGLDVQAPALHGSRSAVPAGIKRSV